MSQNSQDPKEEGRTLSVPEVLAVVRNYVNAMAIDCNHLQQDDLPRAYVDGRLSVCAELTRFLATLRAFLFIGAEDDAAAARADEVFFREVDALLRLACAARREPAPPGPPAVE